MNIIPVLDILNGRIVRGIAGQRERYQPIVSRWTTSAEPLEVAKALSAKFGFRNFYVADLDAIISGRANDDVIRQLLTAGFSVQLDAGIATDQDASAWLAIKGLEVVIGLETVQSPETLQRIVARAESANVVFSIDLKGGRPMAREPWPNSPRAIADVALQCGIHRLLILDLAHVGMGGGLGTEALCRELRSAYPHTELSAGGGVRGLDDLLSLKELDLTSVLVASALHDGRLTPEDLANFV